MLKGAPRMRYSRNRNTFYCFSPPVMIATFAIEIALAAYALWRYKWMPLTRLAMLMLVALGIFQLAEFMVCRSIGDSLAWSRIGFVAITLLPPLGIHVLQVTTRSVHRIVLGLCYATAVAFGAFFLLAGDSFSGHACLGNYVIFQVAPTAGGLFAAYYYGLLTLALGLGWYQLRQKLKPKVRRAVCGMMLGYSAFILPTIFVNFVHQDTMAGIPSIMCGFAVLFALALGFIVLPASAERKK